MTTTPQGSTPGPWTWSADSSFIRDSRGVGVAKVYAWAGVAGDGALPHKGNAALIASAPTMRARIDALETALRDAEFLLRQCGTNWKEAGSMSDSMKRSAADIRALLAKDGAQ